MTDKMRKITEYESRLLEDRKWLSELLEESGATDSDLVKKRLEHFSVEVSYMEKQLAILKKQSEEAVTTKSENMSAIEGEARTEAVADKGEEMVGVAASSTLVGEGEKAIKPSAVTSGTLEDVKQDTPINVSEESTVYVVEKSEIPEEPKKKDSLFTDIKDIKDLEQLVGKSFMGIAASVLIFCSIIAFAVLLMPNLGNVGKLAIIYFVSGLFLVLGYLKMIKDPENKFYIALTGCGVGALYISLLLSNIYFKVIGDIPLYILICVWSAGAIYLAKKNHDVFHIIGAAGICIAMLLGELLCENTEDASKFLAVIVFYIISGLAFNIACYKKEFYKNIVNHASNVINLMILANGCNMIVEEGITGQSIIVMIIAVATLGFMLWSSLEECRLSLPITYFFYVWPLTTITNVLFGEKIGVYLIYALVVATIIVLDKKICEYKECTVATSIIAVLYVSCVFWGQSFTREHLLVWLVVIPLLLNGFYRMNTIYKFVSITILIVQQYILYLGNLTTLYKTSGAERFLTAMVVAVLALVLIYMLPDQYNKYFKYSVHTVAFLLLTFVGKDLILEFLVDRDISAAITYTLAATYNLLMMKFYGRDFRTGEREGMRLYGVLNLFMMLTGSVYIFTVDDPVFHMVVIMVAIVTFMVNAKRQLDRKENLKWGIYVGIKFALLLIMILASFDAPNYVVSIACFVFAILAIVIGFAWEYKSLRVFGLVLSSLSIFKLLVIDINYDNSLGNALSFFISGILCFAISMIYNYIDKNMPRD